MAVNLIKLQSPFAKLLGSVDIIFIGMECQGAPISWLYGPLFSHIFEHQHDRERKGGDAKRLYISEEILI